MVSPEKIAAKMIQMDEYLKLIDRLGKTEKKVFLADKILIGSAKYYLQVTIESCLDIANHIIASERYRSPKDYADSFAILQEEDVIPNALAKKLQQMAKFRNRLVHLYGEIDDEYVYNIIQSELKDIRDFQKRVIEQNTQMLFFKRRI